MEIKGTLRPGDLLSAQWVHMRPRWPFASVGVLLLALCIWALWYLFSILGGSTAGGWLLVASAVFLALLFASWLPYRSRRQYGQRKDLQREYRLVVSDVGLTSENEMGRSNTPWADFLKWKEGNKLFLLYLSDELFQVVPKRFFNAANEIDTFRETLRAKVIAK